MKAGMRILAVNNARRNRERMEMAGGGQTGMEYRRERMGGYPRMGEEPEMRYPDMGEGGELRGIPEARFRDRRGRDHYDNGRFAPMGMEARDGSGDRWARPNMGIYQWTTPYYEREGVETRGMTRPIGFDMTGARREVEYEPVDEMRYRRGKEPQRGRAEHWKVPKFDMETAKEWTENMKNEDGTRGPHWTMEQLKPIMQQKGIDADPTEFFAVVNAMYSDYGKVAKKYNVGTIDFYVDLAKAWLDDKDAVPDKAAAYYEYVVRHE